MPTPRIHLNGIAPAQVRGCDRCALAFQVLEIALHARGTIAAPRDVERFERILPKVYVDKTGIPRARADNVLDRLRAGDGRHHADNRRDHSGRVARGERAGRRLLREYAAQARGLARHNRERHPVTGDRALINPRDIVLDARIVDEEARLEIVRPVKHEVRARDQLFDILCVDIGHDALDLDRRVDAAQFLRGGNRLGHPARDIVFVEEHLALQVVQFDKVAVGDHQRANAGARERIRQHGAIRAAADNHNTRGEQFFLARRAELGENNLPNITVSVVRVHQTDYNPFGRDYKIELLSLIALPCPLECDIMGIGLGSKTNGLDLTRAVAMGLGLFCRGAEETITIKKSELKAMLRQVVREELARFAATPEEDWAIEEGSPLWQDLMELKKEYREGRLQLYARKEDLPE